MNSSLDVWADRIIKIGDNYRRRNTYEEIIKAGYDIMSTAKYFEEFYKSIYVK